jgi:elongation factor G
MADPYIGKLSIFRIFSGTIKVNSSYYLSSSEKTYKFTNIFRLQGKNQSDISEASCGDIAAVSKIMDISNDDTISTQDKPLKIPQTQYFSPTLPKAVTPKSKGDEEKISNGISKLMQEDPTIKQELDLEVHQNIVWGMGELHHSIIKEKLKEKFDVGVDITTPDVAYKETIRKDAKAEYKYKKQSGGRGQYGHVFLEIKPMESGGGFEFKDSIFGGAIPKGYIPGVEKGVKEALLKGVLAESPVVDISVNLYDGSFHNVDSSEMAFKIAGSMAFKKAMQEASPVILEPIMELEITVPEKYMGDIIGDINAKRGKIISMTQTGNKKQLIKASVPQYETFNYTTDLTSLTQGRGRFTQKFLAYEEMPPNLAQKVIDERKSKKDE